MADLSAADRLAAHANRAACRLKCDRFAAALEDVTEALGLLLHGTGASAEGVEGWVEALAGGTDEGAASQSGALINATC